MSVLATSPIIFAESSKKYKPVYDEDTPSKKTSVTGFSGSDASARTMNEVESGANVALIGNGPPRIGRFQNAIKYIEPQVEHVRCWINSIMSKFEHAEQNASDRFFGEEYEVISVVSKLHDKSEPVLPSVIYILIAGLGGSIISRRQNIMVRALVPTLFGVGTWAALMPQTFENAILYLTTDQSRNIPKIANVQKEIDKQVEEVRQQTSEFLDKVEAETETWVSKTRKTVENWIGRVTPK